MLNSLRLGREKHSDGCCAQYRPITLISIYYIQWDPHRQHPGGIIIGQPYHFNWTSFERKMQHKVSVTLTIRFLALVTNSRYTKKTERQFFTKWKTICCTYLLYTQVIDKKPSDWFRNVYACRLNRKSILLNFPLLLKNYTETGKSTLCGKVFCPPPTTTL